MGENAKNKKIKKKEEEEPIIDFGAGFYANGAQCIFSDNDFVIEFYQEPPKENGHYEGIRIYMTTKFAEDFFDLFSRMLKDYKKKYEKKS